MPMLELFCGNGQFASIIKTMFGVDYQGVVKSHKENLLRGIYLSYHSGFTNNWISKREYPYYYLILKGFPLLSEFIEATRS